MKRYGYTARVMNRFDRHIETFGGYVEADSEQQAVKRVQQLHPLYIRVQVKEVA